MYISSWQVFTWPKVRFRAPELIDSANLFRSLGTSLELDTTNSNLCSGTTVWGCEFSGRRVGIAWEWVAIKPRVVVLGDPMTLLANVDLVDEDGELLLDSQRLLLLHQIIFALPWQQDVQAARWPEQHRMAA